MTGAEIMYAVLFFLTVSGALWAIWWRIEGKIDRVKADVQTSVASANALAAMAREELSAHKLHTAETYVTKQGMQEQTSQLLRAIENIGNRLDGLNERLDRAFDHPPTPRRRASS